MLVTNYSYISLQTSLQGQCQIIIHQLTHISNSLKIFEFSLHTLRQGILPTTLLSPTKLYDILFKIKQDAPKFNLPFRLNELEKYFKFLKARVISTKNIHSILIEIPLIHLTERYELYNIMAIPIPYENSNKWM